MTLLGTGALLSTLPIGTCRECPHCRLEQLAHERKHVAATGQVYAARVCPVCRRDHRADEDHPF